MNLTDTIKNSVFSQPLSAIKTESKCIINTINAYSYCVAKKDKLFAEVLSNSDVLLADGTSIVMAAKLLATKKIKKIAGADIHEHLLQWANSNNKKVFYLGASTATLELIQQRILKEYPQIQLATYSPPFKPAFSKEDTNQMLEAINKYNPAVLFVGMTAPKQEKWVYANKENLKDSIICSIGAVFDFYAGTVNRAPKWMIKYGLEWLYRLVKEPKRMWRRYLIGNTQFIYYVFQEKLQQLMRKTS